MVNKCTAPRHGYLEHMDMDEKFSVDMRGPSY